MNMSPDRLSMNCPWRIGKVARPARLRASRSGALGWPASRSSRANTRERRLARPAGFEPATPGLEGRCSIQLSYGRMRCEVITLYDAMTSELVGAPPTGTRERAPRTTDSDGAKGEGGRRHSTRPHGLSGLAHCRPEVTRNRTSALVSTSTRGVPATTRG